MQHFSYGFISLRAWLGNRNMDGVEIGGSNSTFFG